MISLTHVASGESWTITEVLGYESTRKVGTVVHEVIGRSNPDFTVKPVQPRTGTFRLFCLNEATAMTLATNLTRPGPFALSDTATALANTTFLVKDEIGFELDDQTRIRCIVTIGYQEVSA